MPSRAPLAAYLPPHLVRSLAARRAGGPDVVRRRAALLLLDVSGFTSLTERLQASGREGAETVAHLIDRVFRPAVRAIEAHGGSIVSFGGDSMFCIFDGREGVARAARSAAGVSQAFARAGRLITGHGMVPLRVTQAIHHGEVLDLHLGKGERRLHVVTGSAVLALAAHHARIPRGTLRLSPQAARARTRVFPIQEPRRPLSAPGARVLEPYLEPRLRPLLRSFEGAYRRVAILFLETRGTSLAAANTFHARLTEHLDAYDGVLLKTDLSPSGIKWLAVFGIPAAHEDDPARAARAATDLLASLPRGTAVRGGVDAGVVANVVIGTPSRRCLDVMGDVVNIAARALQLARWGEVVMTESARLLAGRVPTEDRGVHRVKGRREPLRIHALGAGRAAPSVALAVMSDLVGRAAEISRMEAARCRVREGGGAVVAVRGAAGLGKSRLKWEVSTGAAAEGFHVVEGQASPVAGSSYGVVRQLLGALLGVAPGAPRAKARARLRDVAAGCDLAAVDLRHLDLVLHGAGRGHASGRLDARSQRRAVVAGVRKLLGGLASRRPLLVVMEDMHWADALSRDVAASLAREGVPGRVLLLLLGRVEYEAPPGAEELTLGELTDAATREIVLAHLKGAPEAVQELICRRAEGNPFFVEELIRHLIEMGSLVKRHGKYELPREPRAEDLPGRIEGLIEARLDTLGPQARRVCQSASVIGRVVSRGLLRHLEPSCGAALVELARREILVADRRDRVLVFKHALTRDAAYATLLGTRRRELHRGVAAALRDRGLRDRASLAMLGYHQENGGMRRQARASYLRAARAERAAMAHDDARRLYGRYLALADRPTSERAAARGELGDCLRFIGDMTEARREVETAASEARELGDVRTEAHLRRFLGNILRVMGLPGEAEAAVRRGLGLARAAGDVLEEAMALTELAGVGLTVGKLAPAERSCRKAIRLVETKDSPFVLSRAVAFLAQMVHSRGDLAEARVHYERALGIARATRQRQNVAIWLGSYANLLQEMGRTGDALSLYRRSLAMAREIGDRHTEGYTLGCLASIDAERFRLEAAASGYEQAVAALRAIGDRRLVGCWLGKLGEVRRRQGRLAEARRLVEESLSILRQTGDRVFEAFVLATFAEVCMGEGRLAEARRSIQDAAAVSRAIGDPRGQGFALSTAGRFEMQAGLPGRARVLLRRALRVHRESGHAREEGVVLGILADLERDAGRGAVARRLVAKADGCFARSGDRLGRARLWATRGHLALAAGRSASRELAALRRGLRRGDGLAGPDRDLVSRLARAQAAFRAGRPVDRGLLPADARPPSG